MNRIVIGGDPRLCQEYETVSRERGFSVVPPDAPDLRDITLAIELSKLSDAKSLALPLLERRLPDSVLILTSSVIIPLRSQRQYVRHDERLIGIGAFPSLLKGTVIELTSAEGENSEAAEQAASFVRALDRSPAFVADTVGMVFPRILCGLVNEACRAYDEGVASAVDIDRAMMLGMNFPEGPLAWGERIGFATVLSLLQALHQSTGDERYAPAPSLLVAAGLGVLNLA